MLWRNDRTAIAQNNSWKHATKTVREQCNNKNAQSSHEKKSAIVIRAIDCDNFAQSLGKWFLNNLSARAMFSEWTLQPSWVFLRGYREKNMKHASCQKGGREVIGRRKCSFCRTRSGCKVTGDTSASLGTCNAFHIARFTWPQLGPFFVPACPPLTAINGH